MSENADTFTPPGQATGAALRPARHAWIDTARGLGMLLVIIGHAVFKAVPPALTAEKWIYSFHIPLFFFISGLVTKEDHAGASWLQDTRKAARSLLLPYAVFGAMAYVAWLLVLRRVGGHHTVPLWVPLQGLLYGTFDAGLGVFDAPLWFLPCLFCTLILRRSLPGNNPLQTGAGVVLLFIAGLTYVKLCPWRLPWGLDVACLALLFLYVGQKLRPWLAGLSAAARLRCLLAVPILLAVQTPCAFANTRIDMGRGLVGQPALFLLEAFTGTFAAVGIASYLPVPFFGSFLGRNTIIIFPLHLLCFSALSAVLVFVPVLARYVFLAPAETIAIFVSVTVLAFLVIDPVIKAIFPWLFPEPKARPATNA